MEAGRCKPSGAFTGRLAEALHRQEALDLVVLDALAPLLPGYAETCAPKLLDCTLPLQALANQGPAAWLLHHPAKDQRMCLILPLTPTLPRKGGGRSLAPSPLMGEGWGGR